MTPSQTRRLYLFEDATARSWEPFSLTRPTSELLHGALLLRERLERATGLTARGLLGAAELAGFAEPGTPPVLTEPGPAASDERLLLSSRYLPPLSPGEGTPSLDFPTNRGTEAARLVAEGRTVGWLLPPGTPLPDRAALARPDTSGPPGEEIDLPGTLLDDPWTLMAANPKRIATDLAALFPDGRGPGIRPFEERRGVDVIGPHPVSVGEGVEVDPGVVLDVRNGPIHLAEGVRVRSLTRIEGPSFIGPGSIILGGVVAATSLGPVCKIHGEVDTSIVLGYSNKAHAGYLGHAVLGRWVNLGAFTTNSDLKNTYGTVRVPRPGGEGEVETGMLKAGALMGDHVRTGIGTLLNTGSVIGAGTNVFGGAMPPRYVPPFSWGTGSELGTYRKESFLETTRKVMARRNVDLTVEMDELLAKAWERSRGTGS